MLTVGLAPHALTANAANKRSAPTQIAVSAR